MQKITFSQFRFTGDVLLVAVYVLLKSKNAKFKFELNLKLTAQPAVAAAVDIRKTWGLADLAADNLAPAP
jgi:hypothetical protein